MPVPRRPAKLSPRRAAAKGGVHVHWDLVDIQLLAKAAGDSEPNARAAIVKAHDAMAQQLQLAIAQALEDAVAERGRHQREEQLLLKAIKDKRFRAANVTGFTVGNLEQMGKPVSQYYRNLEIGTAVFVGRDIVGAFQSVDGRIVPPRTERSLQIDPRLLQFRDRTNSDRPGVNRSKVGYGGTPTTRKPSVIHIAHPIEGYHFFAQGTKGFREEGGRLMLELYEEAFENAGIDFWQRWVSRTGTRRPLTSEVSMRSSRGRAWKAARE